MSTLFRALRGKAVLLIAHRVTTIHGADEILFLENGKITEKGSHDELLKLGVRYSSYIKSAGLVTSLIKI